MIKNFRFFFRGRLIVMGDTPTIFFCNFTLLSTEVLHVRHACEILMKSNHKWIKNFIFLEEEGGGGGWDDGTL